MLTLDQLQVGQNAVVESLRGDHAVVQRLTEFGLFEGESITVLGVAPLGDPMEIQIGQTRLTLRKSEAAGVTVSAPPE